MHDDTIALRQPDDTSLRAWARPLIAAFGGDVSDGEFEYERRLLEIDRVIGAIDGEEWVGTSGAYSFRLTVPGGEVGAAGVTMVGVAPSHRRRGVLRQMMGWHFDQAVARGEAVAILWATEGAIYQNFGYGAATLAGTFDIDRTRVQFQRPAEPLGRMRMIEPDEAATLLPPVYEAVRRTIAGFVDRTETRWLHDILFDADWMRQGNGPKLIAVLEVEGVARGYAIYRVKNDWGDRGPNNTVNVLEIAGVDAAAERSVWEWVCDMDLAAHIKAWRTSVPHPLMLQLTEPRRMGLMIRDGMWLRVLDVGAALESRRYAGPGAITFELTDALRPSNAGRWRLEVRDGSAGSAGSEPSARGVASLTPFTGDPDLTLDISDLAATYLGAFTFADLARAGRVGEYRPGAVADAGRLFATGVVPWCSTMF
jgi:predicted acetyltransferase